MVEDYWKLKPLVAKNNQNSFKSDQWKLEPFSGPSNLGLTTHKKKSTPKKDLTYPEAKKKCNLNPFGDADKDGVKNIFDCRPFNSSRQDNPIASAWKKRKEKRKAKQFKEAEKDVARIQKQEEPKEMYFEEKQPEEQTFKIKEHKTTLRESLGQAKQNVGASVEQLQKFGKKISSSKAFAESGIKREAKIRGTTEEEIDKIIDKARKKKQLSDEENEKLNLYQIKQERKAHKEEVLEKASKQASKFAEGPKEFPTGGFPKVRPKQRETFPTQPQTFQEGAAQEIIPVYQVPESPAQVPYTSRLTPTIRTPAIIKRIEKTQKQQDLFPQPKGPTAFELLRAEETSRRELNIERPLPPVGGVDLTTGEPHRVQRYSPVTLRQSFVVNPFIKKPDIEPPEYNQSRPSGRKIGDTIFASMTSPRNPPQETMGSSRLPGQIIVSNLAPKGERTKLPWTNLEPKKGLTPFKFITFDFRKQQGGNQQ